MRYVLALLVFASSHIGIRAQNVFVQMFHPQYQELTPLITDSLFVRTQSLQSGETTRAIGFKHPDGLPSSWKEVRTQSEPYGLWRISQYSEESGLGQILYNDFVDSLRADTIRSRMTLMGNQVKYPDSTLQEIWKNGEWSPIQKTYYVYIEAPLIGRQIDLSWNSTMGLWEFVRRTSISYDGQKRMTARMEELWKEEQWQPDHTYKYEYRPSENKPKFLVWYSNATPVDSTVFWYDAQGLEDSSRVYQWNSYENSWKAESKRVLSNDEAKRALAGNTYAAVNNDGAASVTQWISRQQREFIPGEGVFTDEPKEEVVQSFNPKLGEWQDTWRRTITYQPLPDNHIYGTIRVNEFGKDSSWHETFFAEAWFHLAPDSLHNDPVDERTESFTFSYTCGFYNPYVQNQTLTFPASEVTGDYELKIFGEDGRLVFQQRYDSSGLATVSAPLVSGLYIVSVSRGGVPLCTQKLVVN
jgi:hypothetical protein